MSPAATQLTASASFSGLFVSRVRLFPDLLAAPVVNPALQVPAAPNWLERLATVRPGITLRTELGRAPTSDEQLSRRYDGLSSHRRAVLFECPVEAEQVLFRLIGVFDAL